MRQSGIEAVGAVPWGTHFCQFYQTAEDLIEVLVPYFRQGLADNEYCMWVTSAPLDVDQAKAALRQAVADLDERIAKGQIDILDYRQWYARSGKFSAGEVLQGWADRLASALQRGYEGMRITGNTSWLEDADWVKFSLYEESANSAIRQIAVLALCTYSLDRCGATEIIDVVANHQFALIRRNGGWQIIQSSEHRKTEQALRESQERLSLAQRAGRVGVFDWDLLTQQAVWTPELEDIFGLKQGAFEGDYKGWAKRVHPDDLLGLEAMFAAWMRLDTPTRHWEYRLVRPDGEVRWIDAVAEIIRNAGGRAVRMIGTNVDITERKRVEQSLRSLNNELEDRVRSRTAELQRRADQLARLTSELTLAEQRERHRLAQVLHDHLQQLLVGAKFGLQVLCRRVDDEQRTAVKKVQDLLDESVRTSQSLTVELSPPILHEAGLRAGLEWLARWMGEKHGLTVQFHAEEQAETDRADVRVLLFQSVRELLLNVVKHAGVSSAQVRLALHGDDCICVVVSDSGVGFDPQAAWTRSSGMPASFGLFSIHERLALLGGTLAIDSAPGRGARFTLIAPLKANGLGLAERLVCPPMEAAKADNPGARVSSGRNEVIRVLLVDDHRVMRQGLAALLADYDDIEVAGQTSDGREAVAAARRLLPDVILMDFSMPGMDGIEATRAIHRELPEIRIIGLSMYDQTDRAAAMLEAGASAYLSKSGNPDALLAAIRDW